MPKMLKSPAPALTKPFYSPTDVAQLLGLHSDTILNYIHAGRILAIKLSERTYRIPQREVQRLVAPGSLRPPRIVERGDRGEAAEAFRKRGRCEAAGARVRRRGEAPSRA